MKLEELKVYQLSMEMGEKIWDIVIKWDFFAKDTIGKQLVRAVDSVAANLSEGFGRYHFNETKHFGYYSRGSLYETKTWLTKAYHRKLISETEFNAFLKEIDMIGIKLNNYIKSIGSQVKDQSMKLNDAEGQWPLMPMKLNDNIMNFTAIIIDDVDNSRITLAHDLTQYCPQIKIIGEANSVKTAIIEIADKKPDVVFLDIQLGDGLGFEILESIKDFNFQVIFTTALDSYGIKAIKFSALDYLLKPIDPDELIVAVNKLEKNTKPDDIKDSINLLLNNIKDIQPSNKRIVLNSADKVHMVYITDIIRCESQGSYTVFHLKNKEQIVVTKNLKEYENMLEEYSFIRVHHSHLINFSYLKEFVKKDGGYAVMTDNSQVPVSFRKKNDLLDMIEK